MSLAATFVAAVPGTAATAPVEESPVQPVAWGTCDPAALVQVPVSEREFVTCATYQVPLDHSEPDGAQIDIAMLRRAATDQSAKVGSLFINPGGPGASGLAWATFGARYFDPEVVEKFDVIGFDPRGVGRSTPLRCYQTAEEAADVDARWRPAPVTPDEIDSAMQAAADYSDFCAVNTGPLREHMATEDVARDLDLLRRGLGEEKLNYIGLSYGTLLGATYANLYPDRVRSMVLDGAVDPALRTSNGTEYDRQRAQGFEIALDALLERCDAAGPNCFFSSGDPKAKFAALRDALREAPVLLPNGVNFRYEDLINSVSSSLYNVAAFPLLIFGMELIYNTLFPPESATARSTQSVSPEQSERIDAFVALGSQNIAKYDMAALGDAPYLGDDAYYGVNCTDKPFLKVPGRFPGIAAAWEQSTAPTFARWQAAADLLGCATWPVPEPKRYSGPWNAVTENPIVVLSNFYDPATRHDFGVRMADQLGNSRLLSVDAFGHTILGLSAPVDSAVTRYLVDEVSPTDGVYQPDFQPFS